VRSGDKTPLTKTQVVAGYHSQATLFQRLCHCHYPEELPEVIFAGVGLLCNGNYLSRVMAGLPDDKLFDLLFRLRLLEKNSYSGNRDYMMAILMHHLTVPPYPLDQLKSYPLYPTEQVLFDHNVIPPGTVIHRTPVLSIPKLHTQFLSYQDYLLRNFELVRLESAYDIRSDLVDAIKRVRPVVRQYMKEESNELVLKTEFTGWARMALELEEPLRIMRVAPPKLGEGVPAQVVAELTVDLVHCGDAIRKEWDDLGEYDNLFLIAIDANRMTGAPPTLLRDLEAQLGIDKPTDSDRRVPDDEDSAFPERFGVTCIRGCMILNIRDDNGNIVSDPFLNDSRPIGTRGTKRIMRVELDAAQYTFDSLTRQGTATYQTLNLVVRRRGRENNFKAVLETIRGLMEGSGSVTRAVPSWLQPVLLGYGDPKNASYSSSVIKSYAAKTPGVAKPDAPLDFGDTFLNEKHLADCFPDRNLHLEGTDSEPGSRHNIRLIFKEDSIVVSKYPFSIDIRGNSVRFTPVQVEAIKSGLCLGLTCIVG
jgi:intron-binding protein aquarius